MFILLWEWHHQKPQTSMKQNWFACLSVCSAVENEYSVKCNFHGPNLKSELLIDLHTFYVCFFRVCFWLCKSAILWKQPSSSDQTVCQELTAPCQDTSPLYALSIPQWRKGAHSSRTRPSISLELKPPGVRGRLRVSDQHSDRDYLPCHQQLLQPQSTSSLPLVIRLNRNNLLPTQHKYFYYWT